jgi:molybdopterin-synthase adenylyltransferase
MGSMMALEAVKWIARTGRSLVGRMLIYDALDAEVRTMRIGRREGCGVCGEMRGPGGESRAKATG